MALDLEHLRALVAAHGAAVRIGVAAVRGSAPRETGTEMFVWQGGQSGTIGGGALEWQAVQQAQQMLAGGGAALLRDFALGPALGQCCGGAVRLVWERFDAGTLPASLPFCREVAGVALHDDAPARAPVWIWGAGHIGRALASLLAPLGFALSWVDLAPDCFPDPPHGATILPTPEPERLAAHAPPDAPHIIVTRSHDLDLALCDALLRRGAAQIGLIGSATKWARFQKRLGALGHTDLGAIRCPVGDPALGRHPHAIALGIAAEIVKTRPREETR